MVRGMIQVGSIHDGNGDARGDMRRYDRLTPDNPVKWSVGAGRLTTKKN